MFWETLSARCSEKQCLQGVLRNSVCKMFWETLSARCSEKQCLQGVLRNSVCKVFWEKVPARCSEKQCLQGVLRNSVYARALCKMNFSTWGTRKDSYVVVRQGVWQNRRGLLSRGTLWRDTLGSAVPVQACRPLPFIAAVVCSCS